MILPETYKKACHPPDKKIRVVGKVQGFKFKWLFFHLTKLTQSLSAWTSPGSPLTPKYIPALDCAYSLPPHLYLLPFSALFTLTCTHSTLFCPQVIAPVVMFVGMSFSAPPPVYIPLTAVHLFIVHFWPPPPGSIPDSQFRVRCHSSVSVQQSIYF